MKIISTFGGHCPERRRGCTQYPWWPKIKLYAESARLIGAREVEIEFGKERREVVEGEEEEKQKERRRRGEVTEKE